MTDVREATHVKTRDGRWQKIASKWGISSEGHLAAPSKGGFGVVTEEGNNISMWDAMDYKREDAD